jgi:signal peptidase II
LGQAVERQSTSLSGSLAGFLPWVLVPALVIVLDQLLKLLFVRWIGPDADRHTIELVGSFLAFEYVENTGAAFGIMTSATSALAAISLLISIGGLFMMWREHRTAPLAALGIGLVVGGAVGNVIDRIFRGYVVDFMAVGEFPRFNLADSCITIGVLLLLAATIREGRQQPTRTTQEGTQLVDD